MKLIQNITTHEPALTGRICDRTTIIGLNLLDSTREAKRNLASVVKLIAVVMAVSGFFYIPWTAILGQK